MKSAPTISVVIPCYNDGSFLPETIARLRKQTFKDFEIIIVNDGSTDAETIQILGQFSKEDVIVLHKENGRMSSARNHGVNHAKGEYIAALDADDHFHPTFFEKALPVLQNNPGVAVVTSHIRLFGEVKKIFRPREGNEYNLLFSNQYPACAMVRKHCWDEIGGYDEKMVNGFEDWEFYIRITQKGWTIHVIPQVLFYYRQTKKSTYKNFTVTHRAELVDYIVEKHRDWYIQKLKELITADAVLYKNTRISYPVILKMIADRLTKKYH